MRLQPIAKKTYAWLLEACDINDVTMGAAESASPAFLVSIRNHDLKLLGVSHTSIE
jgi:hypothetical protein